MLDGLTVWGREITRPKNEQSPTIIQHEADRSKRMADPGAGNRPSVHAQTTQHGSAHARLRARVRTATSRFSLAAGTSETVRVVWPHSRTPLLCYDGATELRLMIWQFDPVCFHGERNNLEPSPIDRRPASLA